MRRGVAGTTRRHSAFLLAIHGGQHARVAQLATLAAAPTHMQGLGSYAAFRTRAEPERPQLFSAAQLAELTASPAVVHFTGPPTVTPCAFLNPHVSGWVASCGRLGGIERFGANAWQLCTRIQVLAACSKALA